MRVRHFETFRPICPVCRDSDFEARLNLTRVEARDVDQIIEGTLGCSNERCQHEYPIIDGVPILLPQLRRYVSENILAILGRTDLSATLEDIIGDCCGAGTQYDTMRQHLSSYCWSHYGRWDPKEADWDEDCSVARLLSSALERSGGASGPILDSGCAVGAATFAAAAATNELVLGIDVNFSMVRFANGVLRTGMVEYPLRRCGIVYDRRSFEAPIEVRENVDFWACDVMALPFSVGSFSTAIGLNTLDSVASPVSLLVNLKDVLAVGGKLILTCPYEWTAAVTPIEHWIGGHSARGSRSGASDQILADLLKPSGHPESIEGLNLIHQSDNLHWLVRWHDRGMIDYRVHLVVAERTSKARTAYFAATDVDAD